jgi:multicomponent Na+:H+ antiporter subunit E
MLAFIITTIMCFIVYLLLTTGSGTRLGLWSLEEVLFGIILSLVTGFISQKILVKDDFRMLNPKRWGYFLAYLFGSYIISLAKANFDVAYRVITGNIRPGIVRISPNLSKDLSITMLANSITLTPGTLCVDIDEKTNDLFIHWINVDENALKKKPVDCKYVCGNFPTWIRRIAE